MLRLTCAQCNSKLFWNVCQAFFLRRMHLENPHKMEGERGAPLLHQVARLTGFSDRKMTGDSGFPLEN